MKHPLTLFLMLLVWVGMCAVAVAQTDSAAVKSPDGRLELVFLTASQRKASASGGQLLYRISYQGKALLGDSQLGLDLQNKATLGANMRIISSTPGSADETYNVLHGKSNPVSNKYNSLRIELEETGRLMRRIIMEGRAYDDGVAFRYVVPLQPSLKEFRLAESKKVKVWLWLHWTSVDNQMDEAFPLYQKWGVAGVKIDFMDRDDQWMVGFYHRVLKKAAEHRLMVDFHGTYKPDGMRRTYPNLMTSEGVLGLEYNKWSAVPDPKHNVMLPFTRMLAGPMDYTPGGFENSTKAEFVARGRDPMVMGTRAHQLALFVVFESALQVVADHPSAYEGQPGFEFLRAVPAAWDETRVLNASVGEYVTIARRRGKDWYVGSLTDWSSRELNIPLDFLGAGRYTAEVYADAPDSEQSPKSVVIETKNVDRTTQMKIHLASGGGHAMRIRP